MFRRFRLLMNEMDASNGGGAPTPAAPASPAATNGAAPAAFSLDDIKAAVKATVAETFAVERNGLFADLRKAGALKSEKPNPSPTAPAPAPVPMEAPAAPASAGGMTASEVQTMMARQRAFDRAVSAAGLSDDQIAAVENVFQAVNPPDPSAWVSGFIKTMGLGKSAPPPPATAPTQAPAPAPTAPAAPAAALPNFSDKGPAASTAARDPLAIIQNDPRQAKMEDFHRLVAQHGEAKALEMWTSNATAFLKTVKVRPDGRR